MHRFFFPYYRLFIYLAFGLTHTLVAQSKLVGTWNGTLNIQGSSLQLEWRIKEVGKNQFRSYLSVPQQGAKDIPMDETSVKAREIHIKSDMLQLSFKGRLDATGNNLNGVFRQNGFSTDLLLSRGDILLNRPQEPKPPFPYSVRLIQFSNQLGTCRFHGTLTQPKQEQPTGIIVLFSGSGAQNRDEELFGHKPFAVLADTFTRLGFAVLRVDDRGAGFTVCRPDVLQSFTTNDLIDDGRAYLRFVQDSISSTLPIILFGHSEGCSVIAALGNSNPQVKKLIGFGPALVSGSQINAFQNRLGVQALLKDSILTQAYMRLHHQITDLSQYDSIFQISMDSLKPILSKLHAKWLKSTPPRISRKIQKRFAKIAKTDFLTYLVKTYHPLFQQAWMWHFLRFNPIDEWQKITQKTLLLNGSLDMQTPVSLNQSVYQDSLKQFGYIQYVILPDINHVFQRAQTGMVSEYGSIETTIDDSVLHAMIKFLEQP